MAAMQRLRSNAQRSFFVVGTAKCVIISLGNDHYHTSKVMHKGEKLNGKPDPSQAKHDTSSAYAKPASKTIAKDPTTSFLLRDIEHLL
jgi:hypothetical protein